MLGYSFGFDDGPPWRKVRRGRYTKMPESAKTKSTSPHT